MENPSKHIHIIGICGVATSALAIAFKKNGWKVTGSDKGIYPPVSTELENNKVEFYTGWHPEKIGTPDVIMTGGSGTSPNNPEVLRAKELNIPILSYPEIIEKYLIKKNSIVITGTWGKTTISSMLSFILLEADINPSYFTGGLSLSHPTGALSDTDWSIVEGDEYQVSISDKRPKFVFYKPTHLILTSVAWDHADLYPTEQSYFDTFKKLIDNIPQNGKIIACSDDIGVEKTLGDKKVILYGTRPCADYLYHSVTHTREGISFVIDHQGKAYSIHSPMLGRYNAENITACFAMANEIGIAPEKSIATIAKFKGIKRRLEKRYEGDVTVLDCHAPTADKAASVLESIREVYKEKIIAVYEPNIGGRERESASKYDNAFKNADAVIIPRLTKLKVKEDGGNMPMEGDELAKIIGKTNSNVHYIENDDDVINFIKSNAKKGDVIAFLGSHGFRGMIEQSIISLQ